MRLYFFIAAQIVQIAQPINKYSLNVKCQDAQNAHYLAQSSYCHIALINVIGIIRHTYRRDFIQYKYSHKDSVPFNIIQLERNDRDPEWSFVELVLTVLAFVNKTACFLNTAELP